MCRRRQILRLISLKTLPGYPPWRMAELGECFACTETSKHLRYRLGY